MYILDGNVTTAIVDAIRSLMITFCSLIYRLIVFCFDVFEKIGAANDILSTDIIVNITNKISLILGLFMIFRLTFAFIQYLINPDTMTDKNKGAGNLVTKMIVMVVLLGSTPYMFKLAFSLQNAINEDKIIPRIIMGYSPDESNNATMGGMLAQSTFYTFFRINENVTCKDSDADLALVTTDAIEEDLKSADFSLLSTFVNQKCNLNDDSSKKDYIYELDAGGLGCLVIGVAVLYIVFIFTIQLAVRLFQLAYLQVIAPIPIMMYITPKGDEKLKKWGSQCLTTFLDYFLRTAIIYFVLYLIQEIISNFDSSSLSSIWQTGNNAAGKGYILGVLIIGLLAFAKKVPNLIKEIFPSLGGAAAFNYGLSSPEMKKALTFGLGATAGAIGGAAIGFKQGKGTLTGRAGNAFTGFFRGAAGGAKTKGSIVGNVKKGMSSQRAASQKAYERNNDGSTFWGRTFGASEASITKEAFDKELSLYSDYNGVVDLVDKELEKDAAVQSAMARKQALLERGSSGGPAPTVAEIRNADALIKKAKKSALQVEIGRGTNGKIMSALANAEAIRAKGQEKGYTGFGTTSLATGSAADRMNAFFDNKDSTGIETNEIKGAGGSRNAEYKKAEANAKYN